MTGGAAPLTVVPLVRGFKTSQRCALELADSPRRGEARVALELLHHADLSTRKEGSEGGIHRDTVYKRAREDEIAHFLESDFQILDQCSPVERSFMMIFEDLRIERWAQFRWKGAASEMKRMWNALYKLDRVSRPDVDSEDILGD